MHSSLRPKSQTGTQKQNATQNFSSNLAELSTQVKAAVRQCGARRDSRAGPGKEFCGGCRFSVSSDDVLVPGNRGTARKVSVGGEIANWNRQLGGF